MAEAMFWKCYSCKKIGPEADFKTPRGHYCPEKTCRSEDVFPHRLYKCQGCGETKPQADWFPEYPLDDPIQDGYEAEPCKKCDWRTPAKLVEVPYVP